MEGKIQLYALLLAHFFLSICIAATAARLAYIEAFMVYLGPPVWPIYRTYDLRYTLVNRRFPFLKWVGGIILFSLHHLLLLLLLIERAWTQFMLWTLQQV